MKSTGTGPALRWAAEAGQSGYLLGVGVESQLGGKGALMGLPVSGDPMDSGLCAILPHLCLAHSWQLAATCNVEPSLFIDWFSGHLNFQIEHQ